MGFCNLLALADTLNKTSHQKNNLNIPPAKSTKGPMRAETGGSGNALSPSHAEEAQTGSLQSKPRLIRFSQEELYQAGDSGKAEPSFKRSLGFVPSLV